MYAVCLCAMCACARACTFERSQSQQCAGRARVRLDVYCAIRRRQESRGSLLRAQRAQKFLICLVECSCCACAFIACRRRRHDDDTYARNNICQSFVVWRPSTTPTARKHRPPVFVVQVAPIIWDSSQGHGCVWWLFYRVVYDSRDILSNRITHSARHIVTERERKNLARETATILMKFERPGALSAC